MGFENLSPEVLEKARNCTSIEELSKLAEAEGIALSPDQLEAIAGGTHIDWKKEIDKCAEVHPDLHKRFC